MYLSIKANHYEIFSFKWIIWLLLCGLSLGAGISVKFTALGLFGTIVFHQFIIFFINHNRPYQTILLDLTSRVILLLLPAFVEFLFIFVIHMQLLPFIGDGDGFMSEAFRARLLLPDFTKQPEYKTIHPLGPSSTLFQILISLPFPQFLYKQ